LGGVEERNENRFMFLPGRSMLRPFFIVILMVLCARRTCFFILFSVPAQKADLSLRSG